MYDEYKRQREAKKKDFSLKLPKLKIREANEGADLRYFSPSEWIYHKTNNDDKKWRRLSDHTEDENVKRTIPASSSVETPNFSSDDQDERLPICKNQSSFSLS